MINSSPWRLGTQDAEIDIAGNAVMTGFHSLVCDAYLAGYNYVLALNNYPLAVKAD